jgi:hypothetical protein
MAQRLINTANIAHAVVDNDKPGHDDTLERPFGTGNDTGHARIGLNRHA